MLNADQLAAIRARAEAATPGPWEAQEPWGASGIGWGRVKGPKARRQYYGSMCFDRIEDVEFIAASRADVPALLADLEAAQVRIAELEGALSRLLAALTPPDQIEKAYADFDAGNFITLEQLKAEVEQRRAALEKGAADHAREA